MFHMVQLLCVYFYRRVRCCSFLLMLNFAQGGR
jgi:hypothetical protein